MCSMNLKMPRRRAVSALLVAACVTLLASTGCDRRDPSTKADHQNAARATGSAPSASQTAPIVKLDAKPAAAAIFPPPTRLPDGSTQLFTEITKEAGFNDHLAPYTDGRYMTPEITPGGVAVSDYDGDGRLDILLICHPPPAPYAQMILSTAPNRLFHQEADGTFKEVPGAAGLAGKGFHHGVAIGDVNNDGLPDVYVCNYADPDEHRL